VFDCILSILVPAVILHINTFPGFKVLSDDARIWFLYTSVICMRLYSVLLAIWMSRPNTALPQHQGATGKLMMKAMTSKKSPRLWGPATLLLTGYRGLLVRQ